MTPAEAEKLDADLKLSGRIARDSWIEQARVARRRADPSAFASSESVLSQKHPTIAGLQRAGVPLKSARAARRSARRQQ